MNKSQLTSALACELGLTKKFAKELTDSVFGTIMNAVVKHGELKVQGFGTFKLSPRRAREGVNPQNPSQRIQIPAMNVIVFKAGAEFKKSVRNS